mmetsp:Transcript_9770/g.36419  ORF Transcript_9770/g.36419 Transcript_9770/m.36419 type:complete len:404 (+) Transcript_9770:247-1458(+)
MTQFSQEHLQLYLQELLKQPGNTECCDCTASNPKWASVNIGVFICIGCAGIHRSLGSHISFVRSVEMDTWQPKHVETLRTRGNNNVNRFYMAKATEKDAQKPDGECTLSERKVFITQKYVQKKWFLKDPPANGNATQQTNDDQQSDSTNASIENNNGSLLSDQNSDRGMSRSSSGSRHKKTSSLSVTPSKSSSSSTRRSRSSKREKSSSKSTLSSVFHSSSDEDDSDRKRRRRKKKKSSHRRHRSHADLITVSTSKDSPAPHKNASSSSLDKKGSDLLGFDDFSSTSTPVSAHSVPTLDELFSDTSDSPSSTALNSFSSQPMDSNGKPIDTLEFALKNWDIRQNSPLSNVVSKNSSALATDASTDQDDPFAQIGGESRNVGTKSGPATNDIQFTFSDSESDED